MEIIETKFKDLYILKPKIAYDERGYFFESFKKDVFEKICKNTIIQENQSFSHKNVFRGFHYQCDSFSQSKLVSVPFGCVIDVVIDMRPDSLTFKNYFEIELSQENNLQLFVPRNFAHGFYTKQDSIFQYKCDNVYSKESERGINPCDYLTEKNLNIYDFSFSSKDLKHPFLKDI